MRVEVDFVGLLLRILFAFSRGGLVLERLPRRPVAIHLLRILFLDRHRAIHTARFNGRRRQLLQLYLHRRSIRRFPNSASIRIFVAFLANRDTLFIHYVHNIDNLFIYKMTSIFNL